MQTNRHNINTLNTKFDKMENIIYKNFKDTNKIVSEVTTKLEHMDTELNTKLNKIDNVVYTIQTNVQDTKLIIDDIKEILLSSPSNKYLENPTVKPKPHSYISWFI